MELKETYRFSNADFSFNGRRESDGLTFREVVKGYERDFHTRHPKHYALFLFANLRTMSLLQRSCDADSRLIYGMDLVDGEFDPTTNLNIEDAGVGSSKIVVYGIDSAYMPLDKNGFPQIDGQKRINPLTLLIDAQLPDGVLQLKYADDSDDDDDMVSAPVDVKMLTV
jgi:hypothetical protein